MFDEQITSVETPEEKKRRLGRKRTQRYRDEKRILEPPESFEEISSLWEKHSQQLKQCDPELYAQLLERHQQVEELEAEADEIERGINLGLRAETRTLSNVDSKDIFPDPCLSFRDIKAHAVTNGTASYRTIEADAIKGIPLDAEAHIYKQYGFRLRIESDVFQRSREMLVVYALRTGDQYLDWKLVEEAVNDCIEYRGFSSHRDELHHLIRQHRQLPPLTQKELIAQTLKDLRDAGSGAVSL